MALQLLSRYWQMEDIEDGISVKLNQRELDSKSVCVLVDELLELVHDSRPANLYVDLRKVHRIASIAFGKLITLDKKLRDGDCDLVLCGVDPVLYQAFRSARLTDNMDIRVASCPQAEG
jgi:anti-anti-sigma factor